MQNVHGHGEYRVLEGRAAHVWNSQPCLRQPECLAGAWLMILNDGDWKMVLGGRKEALRLRVLGGVVMEAVPAGQSERQVSAGHTGGEDAQAAVTFSLGFSCLDSDRPECTGLQVKEKLRGGCLQALKWGEGEHS